MALRLPLSMGKLTWSLKLKPGTLSACIEAVRPEVGHRSFRTHVEHCLTVSCVKYTPVDLCKIMGTSSIMWKAYGCTWDLVSSITLVVQIETRAFHRWSGSNLLLMVLQSARWIVRLRNHWCRINPICNLVDVYKYSDKHISLGPNF